MYKEVKNVVKQNTKYKKNRNKKIVIGMVVVSIVLSVGICGMVVSKVASKANDTNKINTTTALERLQQERNKQFSNKNDNETMLDENEVVRVVVNLKSDSVSEKKDGEVSEYNSTLKSTEEKIIDKQESIVEKAEKITGKKVEFQSAYLVNSFSIDAKRKQIDELADIEGVEEVYESSKYTVEMDNALDDANVSEVWNGENYSYTGEGTVVAIIDTGVNYEHKDMVIEEGTKTKYTKSQWQEKIKLLGYGEYKTDKVPFGYNYSNGENDCLVDTKGMLKILKSSMCHGYHVAGITAANGKVKGVAKNAQVIGLKVSLSGADTCTVDEIVKAIEDAVKLGADVINMSLGVGVVSVNDSEFMQQAVNEAAKAGVLCCISAGNSGASGSETSTATNEMNRKDTSTVHTPGVSKSALTVAASTNEKKNEKIAMADFSSWGATSQLDIKPEITAPGHEINSTLDGKKKYATMSGTSMASPYTAGCSAVLVEAIKDKKLDLEGQELNSYLKNCLMNTAKVINDKYGNPYSVRYQGAGLVNLKNAVDNSVIVTCNNEAKVELREIQENVSFTLDLQNYSNKDLTYKVNNSQVYTDYTNNDSKKHEYSIKPVEGAVVTFDTDTVTVPANGNIRITGTVVLGQNFNKNQYVEAFIKLEGQEASDIGLPLLGFYGDWSVENINDVSIYEGEKSSFTDSGTGLMNEAYNYYGQEVKKVAIDRNSNNMQLDNQDVSDDMKYNENISDTYDINDINKCLDNMNNIDDNQKGLIKDYLSKLKDKLKIYPFISEDKVTTIKNLRKGASLAIYKPKYDGYFNVNIDSKYTSMTVMKLGKGLSSLIPESEEVDIINSFNRNYKAKKGQTYLFIFKKMYDYKKGDEYGTIHISKINDDKVEVIENNYNGEKVAFSPNEDGINDIVIPSVLKLRSAKVNNIYVLDSNKQRIRTLATGLESTKDIPQMVLVQSIFAAKPYMYNLSSSFVNWDGKIYDSNVGKYVVAGEGQYYIQIESKLNEDSIPQSLIMPVKIDNTKPTISDMKVKKVDDGSVLTFKVNDNIGISPDFYIDIEGEDDCYTFTRKYTDTNINENNEYEINLGSVEYNNISILVDDMAGNSESASLTEGESLTPEEDEEYEEDDEFDIDLFMGKSEFFKNNIITSDKLNEDGTYSTVEEMEDTYDSIKINGIEAKIDKDNNQYEITIPLKYGENILKVETVCDGEDDVIYEKIYVEDVVLQLNNNVLVDDNNYIVTNNDTIDMSGIVNSYISLENINVNGNSVFSNLYGVTSHDGNKLETSYNSIVNLQEGINNIVIEINTTFGYVQTINYIVEYKK